MTQITNIPEKVPFTNDELPPVCYSCVIDDQIFEVRGTIFNRHGEEIYRVYRDGKALCNVATIQLGVRWIDSANRKPVAKVRTLSFRDRRGFSQA